MKLKDFGRSGYLLAAALLLPGMSLASAPRTCMTGAPTAESHTWNFSQEATNLLNGIQLDAWRIQTRSDELRSYNGQEPLEISWQMNGDKLIAIKHDVNDMGAKLCRLETIRRVVKPWQQQAIDHNARLVQLMADNTTDAINYLNAHHDTLWLAAYGTYVTNLYRESGRLSGSMHEYVQHARRAGNSSAAQPGS